jgi:hypothetical protein
MTAARMRAAAAVLSAVAIALLPSACGGEPTSNATAAPPAASSAAPAATPAPTARATPAPSATVDLAQVTAVANRIFPPGPSADCFPRGLDGCPFTPRLKTRLQAIVGGATGGGGDPVCRCQNTYPSVSISSEVVSGQPVAHVVMSFGGSAVKMDWVFLQSGGAWLADDSYCTTRGPGTSIYAQPGPCST